LSGAVNEGQVFPAIKSKDYSILVYE